jgi:hypothetical protein
MENQNEQKNEIKDLSIENEIKLLQSELKELNKELAICQKLVAKRDDRAKDYILEIEAIKKDIEAVNEEIQMLIEAKEEEELWDNTLEDGLTEEDLDIAQEEETENKQDSETENK